MAFVSTSKEIYIDENGSMLHAKCLKKDGTTWVASQLELDTFIGNNDGKVKSKTRQAKGAKRVPRDVYIGRSELFSDRQRCYTRQNWCIFVGEADQEGRRTR